MLTKIMKTNKIKIKVNGKELENVKKFEYLGSMLYNNGNGIRSTKKTKHGTAKTKTNEKYMARNKQKNKNETFKSLYSSYCHLWVASHGQYLKQLPS